MRAKALLLFLTDTAWDNLRSASSFLRKLLGTVTTELGSRTVSFAALVAELRLFHTIIWFPVFSHRVNDGARTRDVLDHNQVLFLLSYTHHEEGRAGFEPTATATTTQRSTN